MPRMAADYEVENGAGCDVRILRDGDDPIAFVRAVLADLQLDGKRIGIDDNASARLPLAVHAAMPAVDMVSASDVLGETRRVKDPDEIAALARAAEITDQAFAAVVSQ